MGYAGWVHMQGTAEGGEGGEEHFDTVSGTYAHVGRGGPTGFTVRMYVPGERKEVTYDASEGVVRIGDMAADFAAGWAADMRRKGVTVEQLFAERPGALVTRTNEGDLDRYEVSAPAEDGAACADGRCPKPAIEWMLWADAATGLVRRGEGTMGGTRMSIEYTYGEPAIRDVYDLGVPRDARVVDNRADVATTGVLDRLRRRYEAGFGDYVAFATQRPHGEDGCPVADRGGIHLYARSGAAVLANHYVVGTGGGCGGGGSSEPRPPLPAGWPMPELRAVLDALTGQAAFNVLAGDGTRVWCGQRVAGHDSVRELTGRWEQMIPSLMARETLPGRVWPVRDGLEAGGPNSRVEVRRDRPGLAGLRVDRMVPDCGGSPDDRRRMRRSVMTFWLDPLRDDVPVESTWQSYAAGSDELEIDGRTTYTDWARTSDGRWYPSAWRVVTRFNHQGEWTAHAEDWRLRVWAGERLGAEWFAAPTAKGEDPPAAAATAR